MKGRFNRIPVALRIVIAVHFIFMGLYATGFIAGVGYQLLLLLLS